MALQDHGIDHPRLPPAIMQYPGWCVKLTLALLYSSVLLVSFFGPDVHTPLSSPLAQNKSGNLGKDHTWQVAINGTDVLQGDSFLGLSISSKFAQAIASSQNRSYYNYLQRFSESVDISITLGYVPSYLPACLLLSQSLPISLQTSPLKLVSNRLALFNSTFFRKAFKENCPEFQITITTPSKIDAGNTIEGLLVERRSVSWADGGRSVRIFVLCLCIFMLVYLVMHAAYTCNSKSRLAIGIRSSALSVIGVMCLVDPIELTGLETHFRWMVPFGVTVAVCAWSLYPLEMHGALTEFDCSQGIRQSRPSKELLPRWLFKLLLAMMLAVNFFSIIFFNTQVFRALAEAGDDPVVLANWWTWNSYWGVAWTILCLGFWAPSALFVGLLIINSVSLEARFKKYPYSACRNYFIIYSFTMLVILVAVMSYLLLLVFLFVRWSKSGPWSQLDLAMAMQLLPNPSTEFILEQAILCPVVFVSIVGLRGVTSRSREHHAGNDATDMLIPAAPLPCNVDVDSVVPVFPGISLAAVRVLCHCSHVTYKSKRGKDLTEEHLRTGRPRLEDDMDYSALVLHRVIRRESPSDLGLVVFVASDPDKRVGIVSFRGTANKKNLFCTGFDVQMEPLRLPRSALESNWSAALVHRGFQTALLSVHDELCDVIRGLDCTSMWFTGHSMGGALATLMAAEFSIASAMPIGVCTFASPRVGNARFVESFKRSGISSVRVVCGRDPVTDHPICGGFCSRLYKHVHGLVRVTMNGHLVLNPNFLEETLRKLHHLTNWAVSTVKVCCCQTAKHHKIRGYVAALSAAQSLEGGGVAPLVISTQDSDMSSHASNHADSMRIELRRANEDSDPESVRLIRCETGLLLLRIVVDLLIRVITLPMDDSYACERERRTSDLPYWISASFDIAVIRFPLIRSFFLPHAF